MHKTPIGVIVKADHLILARLTPYAMNAEAEIDSRVYGICTACLQRVNDFQRASATDGVDVDNPNIVIIKPQV